MSQCNFFFSFFREKYNLLVWSTLSTFFEEAVHFLIKGGRNYQDPFFQKSFSYSSVLCLVVFFNLLCVKINSSQKNLLIVPKSFKNSSSVKRNSYVFNTVRFSKSIYLMEFSKNVFLRKVLSLISYFASFFGFSSLKGLK